MADVTLELGGARRVLQFPLGAWAALEREGYDLTTVFEGFHGGQNRFTATRALLWAMLQHEDPAPSLTQVGTWITARNLPAALQAIAQVLVEALPDEPAAETPSPPPPAARIGGPSGGSRRARST